MQAFPCSLLSVCGAGFSLYPVPCHWRPLGRHIIRVAGVVRGCNRLSRHGTRGAAENAGPWRSLSTPAAPTRSARKYIVLTVCAPLALLACQLPDYVLLRYGRYAQLYTAVVTLAFLLFLALPSTLRAGTAWSGRLGVVMFGGGGFAYML